MTKRNICSKSSKWNAENCFVVQNKSVLNHSFSLKCFNWRHKLPKWNHMADEFFLCYLKAFNQIHLKAREKAEIQVHSITFTFTFSYRWEHYHSIENLNIKVSELARVNCYYSRNLSFYALLQNITKRLNILNEW